jgi:hypothetical protein
LLSENDIPDSYYKLTKLYAPKKTFVNVKKVKNQGDLVVIDASSQLKMIFKYNWSRIKDYKSNYPFVFCFYPKFFNQYHFRMQRTIL